MCRLLNPDLFSCTGCEGCQAHLRSFVLAQLNSCGAETEASQGRSPWETEIPSWTWMRRSPHCLLESSIVLDPSLTQQYSFSPRPRLLA